MPENEKQPDYDGLKETIDAIKEARNNARENPADVETVKGFRAKKPACPKPVRKRKEMKIRSLKHERKGQLTKINKCYKGFFLEGYKNLLSLGLSETTISRLFGVDRNALKQSRQSIHNEEIELAYQDAMDELELKLSHLMLVMAKGYEIEEQKFKFLKNEKTGRWNEVERILVKKHHPGEIQALIMYLTNRFPDKWKVSRELLTGKTESYDSKPGQRNRKAIESLARDVLEQNPDRPEAEHPVQDGLARVSVGSEQAGEK
jgi:hypothetical protein